MQKNTTLEININEEYKIRIEDGNDFSKSIFIEVYLTALKNVTDIVTHSNQNKNSLYDDYNNIIAFTGERGKGKSSSMISFRDALVNKENREHSNFFSKSDDQIRKASFATIDVIDPSLFRGDESLFEIILAKLFQKFQVAIGQESSSLSQDDKRTLITCFQDVFENLQVVNSNRSDLYKRESIEVLSKLATSSNLKESFKKLVQVYLNKFEDKKNFLLLAIDDFDLSFSNTYMMLEDIRRFFIQSNIIILISYNKSQLFSSINSHFKREIIGTIDISQEEFNNRTSKYLEKLIPISRTIEIPNFTLKDDRKSIKAVEINKYGEVVGRYSLDENSSINNLYNFLIFYISSRLNLFVTNYKLRQNLIIPKTLREIKEIIQNIQSSDLKSFKKFLLLKSHNELDQKYYRLFDIAEENKNMSLLIIEQYLLDHLKDYLDSSVEKYIDTTNADHLSVGDLISIFEEIETKVRANNVEILKFIDYTKVFLSILIKEQSLENSNKFIYNGLELRFPRENNSTRRDWVKFNLETKLNDYKNNESIFLVYALIHIYGNPDFAFRKSTNNYFFRIFENFNQGVINPFAVFTNYFAIKEFIEGKKSFSHLNSYFSDYNEIFLERLEDPSFAIEFVQGISKFAYNYREKLPEYFNLMYIYLYEGGLQTLEDMHEQSAFIIDENLKKSFENFPIFKLWRVELDSTNSLVRGIVNDMYESSKTENSTKKNLNEIRGIINDYVRRDLTKSRTRTYFRKKIESIDPKSPIIKLINDFSLVLNNRNADQLTKERELANFVNRLNRAQ